MEDLKNRKHIVFNSPEEMLDYICSDFDIYNLEIGDYIFRYNEPGSICVYNFNLEEAEEIEKEANELHEYWGGFIGGGGSIYDDPSHELYSEDCRSNLDYCKEVFNVGAWVDVTH